MAEEARAALDVVDGMHFYLHIGISLFMLRFVHVVIRDVPSHWYPYSCTFYSGST